MTSSGLSAQLADSPDLGSYAAANAFALAQWPLSVAALRPRFLSHAMVYVADWAVAAASQDPRLNPNASLTVFMASFVADGGAWPSDELLSYFTGLYGTCLGDELEMEFGYTWLTGVVGHMLSQPGSEPLVEWGAARLALNSGPAGTVLEAVAEDFGSAIGLGLSDLELRSGVINDVGRFTLAQIAAIDGGRAGRSLASAREDQRIEAIADRR